MSSEPHTAAPPNSVAALCSHCTLPLSAAGSASALEDGAAEIKAILHSVEKCQGTLVVSACLAGAHCRYDCGNCLNESIKKLVDEGKAIAICPEQLGGLPTPRTPSEIVNGEGKDVIKGNARVMTKAGEDVTRFFIAGAETALHIAMGAHALMAILKLKSPSCGVGAIYDGSFSGGIREGNGIAATMLESAGIKVIHEDTWSRLV